MPETPIYGFDTPAYGDEPDGPAALSVLATQVETVLATMATDADLDAETAARIAADSAAAAMTTTTNAAAIGANFTLTTLTARKIGQLVQIEGSVLRINSDVAVDVNGNCTNTVILTLNAGFRPIHRVGVSFLYASGSAMCHGIIEPTGTIQVVSALPNTEIAIGTALTWGVCYLVP